MSEVCKYLTSGSIPEVPLRMTIFGFNSERERICGKGGSRVRQTFAGEDDATGRYLIKLYCSGCKFHPKASETVISRPKKRKLSDAEKGHLGKK